MKKKIDATTLISIVLIVFMWFEKFFGGSIYIKPSIPNDITRSEVILEGIGLMIMPISCIWSFVLIIYSIIRYIELFVKLLRAKSKNEKGMITEYENEKKKIKYITIRNIILALVLMISASLMHEPSIGEDIYY